jgi:hypothetical protein
MGINYKGSQGQTERAVVLQEEEEDVIKAYIHDGSILQLKNLTDYS